MPALASPPDLAVVAAQRGDQDAWVDLLSEHGPLIYGICRRLDPDPDDAYQAVWEKVLHGLHRFEVRAGKPFRSWLVTLAHRHLVDRHRRRQVRRVVVSLADPPDVGGAGLSPEEALDGRQTHALLDAAIADLPAPARRVVVMHHLLGQELASIARIEGVALGTIKSRLARARARLAHALPPDLLGADS